MRRSFQQTFVGEERLRDEPKECLRGRLIGSLCIGESLLTSLSTSVLLHYYTKSRENKGKEREVPGPGLGICQFHYSYI